MFRGPSKPEKAVDCIAQVAEAAGLAAVTIDCEVIASQRLLHEVRDDAAIVESHARTVGVENARDVRVHSVVAMVRHGNGFAETLGFVINSAWAHGIDMPPVSFPLRVFQGVAVNFGS